MKAKPRLSYCFCKVKCAKSQHFSFAGGFAGTPSLAVGLFYTCILQGARQVQGPCCTNPSSKFQNLDQSFRFSNKVVIITLQTCANLVTHQLCSWMPYRSGLFFQRFCKNSAAKKPQFLPSVQKFKAIFLQKLKVGAAFI